MHLSRPCLRTASDLIDAAALVVVFMIVGAASGAAQSPIIPTKAKAVFEEARRLSIVAGQEIWGTELYGPILLADAETRAAVANRRDPAGEFREVEGVWVGTLPEGFGVANTGFRWEDQYWTMLVWPLPYGRLERRRLVAHELFHRVQGELGLPGGDAPTAHLEEEEARVWMRLEIRALRDAVASAGVARRGALEDALIFRAVRHARYPTGVAEESELELNEGLAEYTGVRAGLPVNARGGWVALRLENMDHQASDGSLLRSFAYPLGAAYGLLLDESSPGWHRRVVRGANLGGLLAQAHEIALPEPLERAARERLPAYDGEQVLEEEARRGEQITERLERFRYLIDGPRLIAPNVDGSIRYGFQNPGLGALPNLGVIYQATSIRSTWGTITAEAGGTFPMLLIRDPQGRVDRAVISGPRFDGEQIRGAGWILNLEEGWTVREGDSPGTWVIEKKI